MKIIIIILKKKNNNQIIYFNKFTNEELYPLVIHNLNINPQNIKLNDVKGDGNCLYRSIARFVYGNEDLHQHVRFQYMKKQ